MCSRMTRSKPGRRQSKTACVKPSPLIPCGEQATTRSSFVWLIRPRASETRCQHGWCKAKLSRATRELPESSCSKNISFLLSGKSVKTKSREILTAHLFAGLQRNFDSWRIANRKSRGGLSPTPARVFVDVRISGNATLVCPWTQATSLTRLLSERLQCSTPGGSPSTWRGSCPEHSCRRPAPALPPAESSRHC